MLKRLMIGLALVVTAALAYDFVNHVLDSRRAGISLQLASTKARECEETPTSRCLAELAVLHLPAYTQFDGYDHIGLNLRYVGFGELVDARTKPSQLHYAEEERESLRLVKMLFDGATVFETELPHSEPFVYSKSFYHLLNDFPGFGGGGSGDIINAEKAALARRGAPKLGRLSDTLLSKWRESLDKYGDQGLDWLFFASRARDLGEIAEAKEALSKAMQTGVPETSNWTVVNETWQLYGLEAGLMEISKMPETNNRASAYLNVARLLIEQGESKSATTVFGRFVGDYDENQPFNFNLATAKRRMARMAALMSFRLGENERAAFWADKYAKGNPFASRTANALEAGELYADIGATEKGAAKAYEAITHAPEPGQTMGAPWFGTSSTTPFHNGYVGQAIGILCKVGKFSDAFSLSRNKPEYGHNAIRGCRAAMEGPDPTMSLETLASALSLRSKRQLQEIRAAMLVTSGEYELANRLIRSALSAPSHIEDGSRAVANLSYLRLAVAMRHEKLARDIMSFIAADAHTVSGADAVDLYATAASYTHKWPDSPITQR